MFRTALITLLLLFVLPLTASAEDAAFTDLQGTPRSVSEFMRDGKWTVVMFWSSSCGVCQEEAPRLEAFHQRHKNNNARVLGVSVDGNSGRSGARDFVTDNGLTFANLLGEAEDAVAMFHDATGAHMVGTPTFLVFDPEGEVRTYQVGALDLGILEKFIEQQSSGLAAGGDKS